MAKISKSTYDAANSGEGKKQKKENKEMGVMASGQKLFHGQRARGKYRVTDRVLFGRLPTQCGLGQNFTSEQVCMPAACIEDTRRV